MSRAVTWAVVWMFVAVGAGACGGDDPPPDSGMETGVDAADTGDAGETSPPDRNLPDRVLEKEGVAVTNAAAAAAEKGALEYPVAFEAETGSDPTGKAPLPPEASAVGEFVEVSSDRDVAIEPGEPPLYLALPVPSGAETSELAVAVLTPGRGAAGPASGGVWSVLSGMYDPDTGLFVVPVRFMMSGGATVTLVESGDYEPMQLPGASESGGASWDGGLIEGDGDPVGAVQSAVGEAGSALEGATTRDGYYVVCRGFDGGGCGSSEKQKVREYLKRAASDFSSGFEAPALRRTLPGRSVGGEEGRFRLYVVRPEGSERPCSGGGGSYLPVTRVGTTCYSPNEQEPPSESTTREQFMHAVQYSYALFDWRYAPSDRGAWLIEGPAELAKESQSTASKAVRWAGALRHVDTALTARTGSSPYPAAGTQDFWVYLVNERDSSPKDVLGPLWEMDPEGRPGVQQVGATYDLSGAYWGWVRNQAFESRVTAGNSELNGTCVPNPDAWGSLEKTVVYNTARRRRRDRLQLEGDWRAGVVKVKMVNSFPNKTVKASFGGTSEEGYVRVYRDRSQSGERCLQRNEGPSASGIDAMIESGETAVAYVLLANSRTASNDERDYDVGITFSEPQADQESPSVALERPPAVDYPLKRETLMLKAEARDPGGGYVEPLEWTVEGSGGTTATYRGNDLAVEDFWSEGFQPGTFTITVRAEDDDGQKTKVSSTYDIEKK